MNGIVLINKPKGITTFDLVREARKIFKTKKIGHTGTLDPFASGLVILCIGKATKLSNKLINEDKEYEGTILFNKFYDTYDITGNLVLEKDDSIDLLKLNETTKTFIGSYEQIPPIYSAIKYKGKKLYEYARKNISLDLNLKKRLVNIYEFNIIDKLNDNEYTFKTKVSKGTYIRSLIVDIANKMDKIASVKTLNRTKIGKFSLKDSYNLNELNNDSIISVEEVYKDSPKLIVNDYIKKLVKNGVYLDNRQLETNEDFLVYDENNNLLALYEVIDKNKYKPLIIF